MTIHIQREAGPIEKLHFYVVLDHDEQVPDGLEVRDLLNAAAAACRRNLREENIIRLPKPRGK